MFTTAMIRNVLQNRAEYIKTIKKRKKKSYIAHLAELEAKMNNLDFTLHKFPVSSYLIFCNFCDWFHQTSFFSNYMLIMIIIAGLLVGITTYPEYETNSGVVLVDGIVFFSFLTEICLKMLSEGLAPQLFFLNSEWRWNWFDTLIVIFSFPNFPVGAGNIKLLRLVRLARIGKILRKFPALLMIFKGLVGGLKSCIYIVILMILLLYMFAVAGVLFFRDNDPFHFQTIEVSFVTLLRMATLDNWGDILFINYFGCDVYDAGIYCQDCNYGGSPPTLCNNPIPQPGLFVFYSVLYIFALAFCVLSLFIGTVTVSMSESIILMKEEENARRIEEEKKIMGDKAKEFEDVHNLDRQNRRKAKLIQLAFHGFQLKEEALAKESKVDIYSLKSIYSYIAEKAHDFVTCSFFSTAMICTILLAGTTIGIQSDNKAALQYEPYSYDIDTFIQSMFVIEVGLKIISENLKPWRYFNDNWNIFDFFVVTMSFIPTGSGSLVTMLRLLRLLRVMKLMKALPQLQSILFALVSGTKSITYISIMVVLFIYVYAILGQVLFQESDPHNFGRLHYAMLVLFQQTTFDGWSAIMYTTQYGCNQNSYGGYGSNYAYECKNPKRQWAESAIYWIVFVIIGGLVLLSLFIGVVGIGMEESNDIEHKNEVLLQKAAKIAVLEHLEDSEIRLYKEVFDTVDFASGGSIGKQEMLLGLKIAGMNLNEEDFLKLWGKLDRDGSGNIEFVEFLQFMLYLKKLVGGSQSGSPNSDDGNNKRMNKFSVMLGNSEAVPEPFPDKIAAPVPKKQALKRWGKLRASLAAVKALKINENATIVPVDNEIDNVGTEVVDPPIYNDDEAIITPVRRRKSVEIEVQTDLQIPINDDNFLEPYHQYLLISKNNDNNEEDLMNKAMGNDHEEDINLFVQDNNTVVDNSTDNCIATVENMKQMAENLKKEESMKQHPHPIISELLQKHIQLPVLDTAGGGVDTAVDNTVVVSTSSENVIENNENADSEEDESQQNTLSDMMSRAMGWGTRSPHRNRPSITMQLMDRVPSSRRRKLKPVRIQKQSNK